MREMKDSGIPWIGEIPKEWTIELIGNQVKEVNNPNTDRLEDNALQFKMGSIISKSRGDSKYNPETLEGYNIVDKGVIMLNGLNLSFDLISQRVGLVRERGVITSTYLAVKPTNTIDSAYLTYLFKAYDNCKAFHSMGRGLRQTLSYGELRKYLLVYPSLAEQQKIAEFLDRKCGEIDEMVALQETVIEELKAYKQSVITEAVTKGLNPDVPMRDSGIEWIGQIPEHWEVTKLKFYASIDSGDAISNEQISEEGDYPVYGGGDIMGYYSDYNTTEDKLIIGRVGARCGCVTLLKQRCWASDNALVLKSALPLKYTYHLLQAIDLNRLNTSNAQPLITATKVKNVFIPLTPLAEQQAIADYLDEKCADIDSLIQTKLSKIDSLKEYKKSIIYEYVTGKREVNE